MARLKGTSGKVYKAVRKKVPPAYARNIANKARTQKGRSAMVRKGDRTRKLKGQG